MARVVVTFRIMPKGVEIDLHKLESHIKKEIEHFTGPTEFKVSVQPIAFGLKALEVLFVMDESKGSTEALEHKVSHIDGIESVEVTDVRRAIG